MRSTRRKFLSQSGQAVAVATMATVPLGLTERVVVASSDTLVFGLIGCGGMGTFNLLNHLKQPGVVCGGICDVDEDVMERCAAQVEDVSGEMPKKYSDFRKLLNNKEIDAVIIATPDHWHCLQTVYACQAGKDVYVEKPMANSIAECDLMVAAAKKYKRVVQVGQQQRSGQHWQDVVAFVQSGDLGKIRRTKIWGYFDYGKGDPQVPNDVPPAHLDYNMWLGPAPDQPYNPSRLHGSWRHQWDFGGGLLADWGVHLLDIVLLAMNVDRPPNSVSSMGGIYIHNDRAIETPDTLSVLYDMGDHTMSWEHAGGIEQSIYGRNYGMAFIGENGTLVANRSGWEVIPEEKNGQYLMQPFPAKSGVQSNHALHAINFIEAIKSRSETICTVEDGRLAALYAHMGNIAYRSGSRLPWDTEKNEFKDNPQANVYLKPAYREPWKWPAL